ncbi:15394_t:CDS:2, partial [Cetraspora pellucida]
MTIAIIYMAEEFNWSPKIQGIISSSFYFGYFMTQIIGGALTDKFGGKSVLGIAAVTWSLFTLITPIAARINLYVLIMCRICLGIGEGVCFPCVHSLVSKWFPPQERTRAASAISVSNFIGLVIAMPISNLLGSSQLGWECIFWVFSIIGLIWSVFWHFYGESVPTDYSGINKDELDWILENKTSISKSTNESIDCPENKIGHYRSCSSECITITDEELGRPRNENDMLLPKGRISSSSHKVHKIPWKLLFSRREVWAIMIGSLFNGWSHFVLLNWLPIFFYDHFHVDINLVGYYTVLPYFLYIITGAIVGCICDYAINQLKIRVLTVRRSVCIIGGFGMSLSLLLLDIAPKYAGFVYGLGGTFALIPAFFGVALTGWILEVTGNDWSIIWNMCSLCYIIGVSFFVCWAGGE